MQFLHFQSHLHSVQRRSRQVYRDGRAGCLGGVGRDGCRGRRCCCDWSRSRSRGMGLGRTGPGRRKGRETEWDDRWFASWWFRHWKIGLGERIVSQELV
jgi:hypothetical protein